MERQLWGNSLRPYGPPPSKKEAFGRGKPILYNLAEKAVFLLFAGLILGGKWNIIQFVPVQGKALRSSPRNRGEPFGSPIFLNMEDSA